MGSEAVESIAEDWNSVYVRTEEVAKRTVADEVLLVPISGELAEVMNLFVLEGSAQVLWDLFDGERSLEEVHRAALEHLEVDEDTLRVDLLDFVHSLSDAKLIRQERSEA